MGRRVDEHRALKATKSIGRRIQAVAKAAAEPIFFTGDGLDAGPVPHAQELLMRLALPAVAHQIGHESRLGPWGPTSPPPEPRKA